MQSQAADLLIQIILRYRSHLFGRTSYIAVLLGRNKIINLIHTFFQDMTILNQIYKLMHFNTKKTALSNTYMRKHERNTKHPPQVLGVVQL